MQILIKKIDAYPTVEEKSDVIYLCIFKTIHSVKNNSVRSGQPHNDASQ